MEEGAQRLCRDIVNRMDGALEHARTHFLSEDYFVYSIHALDTPCSAEQLISAFGGPIAARLLRAESEPLSGQERDEVFVTASRIWRRMSWCRLGAARLFTTAMRVRRRRSTISGTANSQLLQFRYYDELLDGRLAQIYKELETHLVQLLVAAQIHPGRAARACAIHRRKRANRPDGKCAEARRRRLRRTAPRACALAPRGDGMARSVRTS